GAGAAAGAAVAALPTTAGRLPAGAAGAAGAWALPSVRLFTFSTTTALVRPWLKLWRTTPCSTPRPFSDNVLPELTLSFFSPVFSVVSAIPIPMLRRFQRRFMTVRPPGHTGPEALEAINARQERLAFGAGKQGCMYHI